MECQNNPENPDAGTRMVPLGKEVFIERDDFMEDPPKKYFRLGPGRAVRLRGGYIIQYVSHDCDADGNVTEVHVEFITGTVGQSPPEGVKCKAAIHWVSAEHAVNADVRLYDRLFTEENPDAAEGGFMTCLNPNSLEVKANAKLEPILGDAEAGTLFQFERVGYFCADSEEHQAGKKAVFNRTVGLRDSWAKR